MNESSEPEKIAENEIYVDRKIKKWVSQQIREDGRRRKSFKEPNLTSFTIKLGINPNEWIADFD